MKQLRTIITIIVVLATVAVGVLFALQNKEAVPLDLLVYTFSPRSLALWVLAAFALGGVAGLVVSSAILLRARATLGSVRRQLARARAELEQQSATELKVTD